MPKKDSSGNFNLKTQHQYYYQTQQQIFRSKKQYCDFVVCAFNDIKEAKLVVQRTGPDIEHWKAVLPKVTNFWRTCVLSEVLGRWYTRQQLKTLSSAAIQNVPSELFTFPAYKLSVCLRPGIVRTVELCQNSGKKENLLNLLGNQAHLPLPWP